MRVFCCEMQLGTVKDRNENEVVKRQFLRSELRCIDLMGKKKKRCHHMLHLKFICFLSKERTSIYVKRPCITYHSR